MTRILQLLFGRRRWLMWLPVPAAAMLDHGSVSGYLVMLVGCCPIWIAYWLACWLSDGFANVTVGGGNLSHQPGVNPATGQACLVLTNSDTGAPVVWIGGDRRPLDLR
jgi:hypothetical protein